MLAAHRLPRASTLAVLIGVMACGPTPRPTIQDDGWGPQQGLGIEPPPPPPEPAPRARPLPVEKRKRWAEADQVAGLHALPGRGPSDHGSGLERTVLRNDAAAGYEQLAGRPTLPVGALIVQRHHQPGSQTAISYYIMHKRAPSASTTQLGWQFLVLDDQLRVATAEPPELCARCHQEAPVDGLYGPPDPLGDGPDAGTAIP